MNGLNANTQYAGAIPEDSRSPIDRQLDSLQQAMENLEAVLASFVSKVQVISTPIAETKANNGPIGIAPQSIVASRIENTGERLRMATERLLMAQNALEI
jgi:hypothetical protein